MKTFDWKTNWVYDKLLEVENDKHSFRLLAMDFIRKGYPVIWLQECIEECFPQHTDTLNKILILL